MHVDPTELYPALLTYALIHLSNSDDATDCVQEVMVSILSREDQFSNKSNFKTYVFYILNNKIAGCLLQRYRIHAEHSNLDHDDLDDWFDEKGHWLDGLVSKFNIKKLESVCG